MLPGFTTGLFESYINSILIPDEIVELACLYTNSVAISPQEKYINRGTAAAGKATCLYSHSKHNG